MTASYQNYEGLRAAFPTIEIECYIQKPVENKDLILRVTAEASKSAILESIISHKTKYTTSVISDRKSIISTRRKEEEGLVCR